jgi:hypothetical protein
MRQAWQVGSILDSQVKIGDNMAYTNLYRNGQVVWEITSGRKRHGFLRCQQVDRVSRLIDCDRGLLGVWLICQTELQRTGIWYRVMPNVWQCIYSGLGFAGPEWARRDVKAIEYFRRQKPDLTQLTHQLSEPLTYRQPTVAELSC